MCLLRPEFRRRFDPAITGLLDRKGAALTGRRSPSTRFPTLNHWRLLRPANLWLPTWKWLAKATPSERGASSRASAPQRRRWRAARSLWASISKPAAPTNLTIPIQRCVARGQSAPRGCRLCLDLTTARRPRRSARASRRVRRFLMSAASSKRLVRPEFSVRVRASVLIMYRFGAT